MKTILFSYFYSLESHKFGQQRGFLPTENTTATNHGTNSECCGFFGRWAVWERRRLIKCRLCSRVSTLLVPSNLPNPARQSQFSLFDYHCASFRFPFYYELKIIFLIWLISPVSRGSLGSSLLYRKLVHPNLMKREDEIDRWMGRVQVKPNLSLKFKSILPLFSIPCAKGQNRLYIRVISYFRDSS